MIASKTCRWHECNASFSPEDPRQNFCSSGCRKKRGNWKAKRGGSLVDPLLNNDKATVDRILRKIRHEIKENTP